MGYMRDVNGVRLDSFAIGGSDGVDQILAADSNALAPAIKALSNCDTAAADIFFIGDSKTGGAYLSFLNQITGHRVTAMLRQRYSAQPRGGVGMITPTNNAPTLPWSVTFTGGGSAPASNYWGLGRFSVTLTPATQSLQLSPNNLPATIAGVTTGIWQTSTWIEWVPVTSGSTLSVTDALGTVHVLSAVTAGTVQLDKISLAHRAYGYTTVACTAGSAVVNAIVPLDGDETTGIRGHVGGHSSITTGGYFNDGGADAGGAALMQTFNQWQPALCVINLITNDYQTGVTVAAFITAYTGLLNAIKAVCPNTCFLCIVPTQPYPVAGIPVDTWANFVAALKGIVAGRSDAAILDEERLIYSGVAASDPLAIYAEATAGQKVHFNATGTALEARAIVAALSRTTESGQPVYRTDSNWGFGSFQNSWSQGGSATFAAQYRKTAGGEIVIEGKIGGASAVVTVNTLLTTLPAGYRPPGLIIRHVTIGNSTVTDAIGSIAIAANGQVTIRSFSASADGSQYIYFDDVRFLAEA